MTFMESARYVVHRYLVIFFIVLLATLPVTASAQTVVPRWEPSACGFQAPPGATVECGTLIVPEQRSAPTERTLRLPVVKIKSRSAQPAPDPVVYTAGGPGASSLGPVTAFWNSPLVDTHDVILFEQRGTRFAEPALDCPELTTAFVNNLAHNLPVNEEIAREVAAASVCRERLVGEGIDLAAYNTAAIVADLQDLRRVLGYTQWNVFGVSYSTRVMQRLMRDDPQGIRSVLLDSAVPSTARWHATQTQRLARSLDVLFARCAAEPACEQAYPDLQAQFFRVVAQLNTDPLVVPISHPITGAPFTVSLDGSDFASGMFNALYDWQTIPFLPLIIDQLDRGNRDVALPLAQDGFASLTNYRWGMYYSVWCQDELPRNEPAAIAADQQR